VKTGIHAVNALAAKINLDAGFRRQDNFTSPATETFEPQPEKTGIETPQ